MFEFLKLIGTRIELELVNNKLIFKSSKFKNYRKFRKLLKHECGTSITYFPEIQDGAFIISMPVLSLSQQAKLNINHKLQFDFLAEESFQSQLGRIIEEQIKLYPLLTLLLVQIKNFYIEYKSKLFRNDVEDCIKLLNLILKNNDPEKLADDLLCYFDNKKNFYASKKDRNKLKKEVLKIFDKPKEIIVDLNSLQAEHQEQIMAFLNTMQRGTRFKKESETAVYGYVFKFHNTITADGLGKFFVKPIIKTDDTSPKKGSYGVVRTGYRVFELIKDNLIENKTEWIEKKLLNNTKTPEAIKEVKNEFLSIQRSVPQLEPVFFIVNSRPMLFMKSAGKHDLQHYINKKITLAYEDIVKILRDCIIQTINSYFEENRIITDIKPLNVIWDEIKQEATIVDHGLTMLMSDYMESKPMPSPRYLSKEIDDTYSDKELCKKMMVFRIGVTLATLIVGDEFLSHRTLLCSAYTQPLNIQLLDTYAQDHSTYKSLIKLIKHMTEEEHSDRCDLNTALNKVNALSLELPSEQEDNKEIRMCSL